MIKQGLVIVADYSEVSALTIDDLCYICGISNEEMHEYLAYDIIHPVGSTSQADIFDINQLQRLKKAIRLQRELEVNLAGMTIVLNLLEETEALRSRVALIEKHFSRD